jgi:hypothetical protein
VKKRKIHPILPSLLFGGLMVAIIWLQLSHPYAVQPPLLRFLAYSITMMLPSIVAMLVSFIAPGGLSQKGYYVLAFIIYSGLFFWLSNTYYGKGMKLRKVFLKKVLTATVLFILWAFSLLTLIYYR